MKKKAIIIGNERFHHGFDLGEEVIIKYYKEESFHQECFRKNWWLMWNRYELKQYVLTSDLKLIDK